MGLKRRLQTLKQLWNGYGPKKFAEAYGRRLGHLVLPAWAFRSGRGSVVGIQKLRAEDIPVLRGFDSRVASPADVSGLCSVFPRPVRLRRFFADGSICAVAENGEDILAMAWARIGPGDCTVDAGYRHGGYIWRLEEGEAWLHNGEARSDLRGTGVYLTAYRKLIEELARLGVSRCYGQIDAANLESQQTHRHLHLQQLATVSYVRGFFVGRYRLCCSGQKIAVWTMRPSLTIHVRDFLSSASGAVGLRQSCPPPAIGSARVGRPVQR